MSVIRIVIIQVIVLLLCGCGSKPYSTSFNLDFEYVKQNSIPTCWGLPDQNYHGYSTELDFTQRQHGHSSLCMMQTDSTKSGWAIFYQSIPIAVAEGQIIELSGWIRTKNVQNGFADFYIADPDYINYDTLSLDFAGRGVRNTSEWTCITVKKRIDANLSRVEIGGILKGDGTAWFDNLELVVDDRKVVDSIIQAPKMHLNRKDKAELRKYIYPLHTFDPADLDSSDLKVLDKLIGSSKVVALGENSHGSSEIFQMKHRLIRYLAKNNGFDIFSIEAYMPESYHFNEYIQKGHGTARNTVLRQEFWIWMTQEMVDMVQWMHDFNRSGRTIAYTGMDMQSYKGSVDILKQAFNHDETALDCIDKIDSGFVNILTYSSIGMPQIDPVKASEQTALLSQLQTYIEKSPAEDCDKEWLLQNINLLRQYIGQGLSAWRDRCMADNLLWIKAQNPASHIVVWAHNGHVEKCRGKMGGFLSDSLGEDYVTFGFTFFDGKYTAILPGSSQYAHEAQTAYPGTLEYLLEQLDEPLFILDLKKIRADNSPILGWIDDVRFRHVGAVKIENEFNDILITKTFDYLLFIRKSSPSKLLS